MELKPRNEKVVQLHVDSVSIVETFETHPKDQIVGMVVSSFT